MHNIISSVDLFFYKEQPMPDGWAEWVSCKWRFRPLLVHLSHLHVNPTTTTMMSQCVVPLSHWSVVAVTMLHWATWWEKFTLSITTFFLNGDGGGGRKLWGDLMWATNSDIWLVFWPLRLPRKPGQSFMASRETHLPLVNWGGALDRLRQRALLDNERLNY